MILTITSRADNASDLGFLLHKHPDKVQRADFAAGTATVFYPEVSDERCTAALMVTVDPVSVVKQRGFKVPTSMMGQYVNDRPYVAGSIMSQAIGRLFKTALNGRCDAKPQLAQTPLPLTIRVAAVATHAVPADDGSALVASLFEPLGWHVDCTSTPLVDPDSGYAWGPAPYLDVTLTGTLRLADALSHLYVLLPALDGSRHYWSGADEIENLLRRGEGWLADHPQREFITRRFLSTRAHVEDAAARLAAIDGTVTPDIDESDDAPTPLKVLRRDAVVELLQNLGVRSVADVGCGEGFYLRALLDDPRFTRVIGVDVSARELERAERALRLDRMPDGVRARLTLRQSSVTYVDDALEGLDAIVLAEVIEHIEPDRHPSMETAIFGRARPRFVIVTTPNREFNTRYGLADDQMRHPDHRLEWTRDEFRAWCDRVATTHGYSTDLGLIGERDDAVGAPTQCCVFTRLEADAKEVTHG